MSFKSLILSKRRPKRTPKKKPKHKKWWLPKKQVTVTSLIAKGHEPKCVCCGAVDNLTFDHIRPKARGGKDITENGQILCKRCNQHKADRLITLEVLRIEIEEAENLKSRQKINLVNMEPTIGRIVKYKPTKQDKEVMKTHQNLTGCNIMDELPATIVSVHGENCINVKVHLDGNAPDLWKTSIEHGDEAGQWDWFVKN